MVAVSSVQTGSVDLTTGTSVTDTITSVTTTNAKLWYTYKGGTEQPGTNLMTGEITNSTTLTFTISATKVDNLEIEWFVEEFSSGVTTQHFSKSAVTDASTQTITSVNTANSYIQSGGIANSGGTWGGDDFLGMTLAATAITFHINNGDADTWSGTVVESSDFDVQEVSDLAWLETTSLTHDDAFTAIGSTDAAFVCFTMETDSSLAIANQVWRAEITSVSNFRLTRDSASSDATHHTYYYVVEPTDSTTIQQSQVNRSSGVATATDTISAVVLANSSLVAAVMHGCPWGEHPRTDDNFVVVNSHVIFASTTTVEYSRNSTTDAITSGCWVVEWDTGAAGGPGAIYQHFQNLGVY